jgi:hypothetical protein
MFYKSSVISRVQQILLPQLAKPRSIGVERLRDPPTERSRQFEALGLNPE